MFKGQSFSGFSQVSMAAGSAGCSCELSDLKYDPG